MEKYIHCDFLDRTPITCTLQPSTTTCFGLTRKEVSDAQALKSSSAVRSVGGGVARHAGAKNMLCVFESKNMFWVAGILVFIS